MYTASAVSAAADPPRIATILSDQTNPSAIPATPSNGISQARNRFACCVSGRGARHTHFWRARMIAGSRIRNTSTTAAQAGATAQVTWRYTISAPRNGCNNMAHAPCSRGKGDCSVNRNIAYWNRMDRNQAWEIVCEFVKSDSLRKHMLAVEACVAAYARQFGEDESKWRVTALLHDFDWEIHPQAPDHPMKGEPILAERGVHEEIRRAILSHANYSGVPRVSPLEKTLFACDELAGFLTAVSYVKPTRSIHSVDVPSVKKKLKDKGFARSVSRDDIVNGAAELGVDLDQHIEFCIQAMRARAAELGIEGTPESAPA